PAWFAGAANGFGCREQLARLLSVASRARRAMSYCRSNGARAPNLPASRALQPPGSKVLSVAPSASASFLLYEERWRTTIYSTHLRLRTLAERHQIRPRGQT